MGGKGRDTPAVQQEVAKPVVETKAEETPAPAKKVVEEEVVPEPLLAVPDPPTVIDSTPSTSTAISPGQEIGALKVTPDTGRLLADAIVAKPGTATATEQV